MNIILRYVLLCASLLSSLSMVQAAQPASETPEMPEQQIKKPTLRKKVYIWAGITTGVITSIAGVVGIYFHTKKRSKPAENTPRSMWDNTVPIYITPTADLPSASRPEQNREEERNQKVFKLNERESSLAALVSEGETNLGINFTHDVIGYIEQTKTPEQLEDIYGLYSGYGSKEIERAYLKKKAALEQKAAAYE